MDIAARGDGARIELPLAEGRATLAPLAEKLQLLQEAQQLEQPLTLRAVLTHVHLNRIGASAAERRLLALPLRA